MSVQGVVDQRLVLSTLSSDTIDETFPLTIGAILATYTLTVNSQPSGIKFLLDGFEYTTPWSGTLTEGAHAIIIPSTVTVASTIYTFKRWEDGSTSPTRTINLTSDLTITATYEAGAPPPPFNWLPIILLALIGGVAVTAVAAYYT